MQIKQIEVSLSKEERRIVDEYGNTASTWARIGITADLTTGDVVAECIVTLRDEIQPQVDDWLLRQKGYVAPPEPTELIEELTEAGGSVMIDHLAALGDSSNEDEIPL